MADKKFGVKQLELIGTGTPTIQSDNTLNLTAPTTAISNDVTIGGNLTVTGSISPSSAIPSGGIIIWSGASNAIPSGWVLCNGSNSTPDLRDKFVVGAGSGYSVGNTGGSANAVLIGHSHTYVRPNTETDDERGTPVGSSGQIDRNFGTYSTSTFGVNTAGNSSTNQTGTNANLPPYYALCYIMKT